MLQRLHSAASRTVALLLCSSAVTAFPQAAGDTIYHLHGTVVNGVTGKVIARALVVSGDRRLATMTDDEGHFAVDLSVPPHPDDSNAVPPTARRVMLMAGNLILTAQKPGYLPTPQPTILSIDDTLSAQAIQIKLMPAAVIIGRVSPAAGESPGNIRVSLLNRQVNDGERNWVQAGSHNTNSHGEFRFANLRPGEYTVQTAEWAGEQPAAQQRTAITRQYPATFYGDTQNINAAGTVRLHYGDTAQAELHLEKVNYYPVTVPIAGDSTTSQFNVRLVGMDAFNGYRLAYNRRDVAVEGSLPNGSYTLLLSGFGNQPSVASVSIHVSGAPFVSAPVALSPSSSIPVRVRTEFTQSQTSTTQYGRMQGFARINPGGQNGDQTPQAPPPVQLLLRPTEGGVGGFTGISRPDQSGNLMLENVQPGRYQVHAQPMRGYVASMTSGTTNLFQQPLSISSNGTADPIDVTLRDDGATLTGTVKATSDPLPQRYFIFLLPTDGAAQFSQGFAGSDGKFTMSNVAPGSYRVIALQTPNIQIPYRDAEAMRHLDGKGSIISVSPGQSLTVDVTLLNEAEVEDF